MKKVLIGTALIASLALVGCVNPSLGLGELVQLAGYDNAGGVAETIAGHPAPPGGDVVETSVEIYGFVSTLGEFFCPCFILGSDNTAVMVRYGLFPEGETDYADLSVNGIANGDGILVLGTLRMTEQLPPEIWAKEIILIK